MTKWNPSLQLPDPCSRPCPCPRSSAAGKVLASSEQTILAPKRSNVVFWTRFAANDTVHFLAACFVETASFALQSAHFRNNAHVFRAKAHVRKTSEANGVVCRNDVQSTRLEPLGDTCVIVSIKMHAMHPNKRPHSFHRFNCIRVVKAFPVLKDSVYKAPCSAICLGVSWFYRPTRVEVNATVGQLKHLSKQLEDRRQSFPQRWGLKWPNLVEGGFIQKIKGKNGGDSQ